MRYIFINKLKSYIFILFAMILVLITENIFGQSTFSGSGAWSSAARWSAGIPNVGTPVTIAAGSICTVDDPTATCASLTFSTGATITFNVNENLNVAGAITYNSTNNPANQTITVNAGKTLTCSSLTMNATNNDGRDNFLIINGNVDINGNLSMPGTAARNALTLNNGGKLYIAGDFTAGTATFTANATSDVYFDGPGNQAVLGRTYNKLTLMNAGIKTISAATTVNDNLTVSGTASLADGGFQITGAATKIFNVGSGASFTTTRTATPWFPTNMTTPYTFDNNSTINFNGDGSFTLPSTQTTFGHLSFGGASVARIKTLPVTTPFTINGNLTISINNTLADAGNTITVKGNVTNNATHSGTGKIYLNGGSASHTISGGTSTFGNVELDDAVNATWAGTGATSVSGTLTVTSGTLSLGAFTTSFTVSGITNIDGALTNSSVTGSKIFVGKVTLDPSWGGAFWDFSGGNSAVELRGGFEQQNAPTSTFTSGSGTYTFSTNSQSLICDDAITFNGAITISGAIQLTVQASTISVGSGGVINGSVGGSTWFNDANTTLNYSNTTRPMATGIFNVSSSDNTVNYSGASQTICATTGNPYYNLILSGSGVKTLNVATSVGTNLNINNNIILDLSASNLTIGASASITITPSATTMIRTSGAGSLIKEFTAVPMSYTYPIGTTTVYTPSTISIAGTTSIAGTANVSIRATTPNHPSVVDATNALDKYWVVSSTNISNIDATLNFTYDDTEIPGGDETSWLGGFYTTAWDISSGTVTSASNLIEFTKTAATNLNADYTAGPQTAFVSIKTWDGGAGTFDWNTANNWLPDGIPTNTDSVIIDCNCTVTYAADATAKRLWIKQGTTLNVIANNSVLTVGNAGVGGLTVDGLWGGTIVNRPQEIDGSYIKGIGRIIFASDLKLISTSLILNLIAGSDITFDGTSQPIKLDLNGGTFNIYGTITFIILAQFKNGSTGNVTMKNGGRLNYGDNTGWPASVSLDASAPINTVDFECPEGALALSMPSATLTYHNLEVSCAANTTYKLNNTSNPLNINGNLTISSGTLDASTNSKDISINGDWTNNSTFLQGTQTVTFAGTSTIYGSTTTQFNNVTTTGTLTGHATNMNVAGNWVNNGTFAHNSGLVTFNGTTTISGTATTTFNNVTISSTLTGPSATTMNVAGTWTNNATFTHNNSTVVFNGGSQQSLAGTSNTTFYNLTNSNASGISLSQDPTINNILALSSNIVYTNTNKVIIPSTGSITRTSGYIYGNLQRYVAAGTPTVTFEVGTNNTSSVYSPVQLVFTGVTVAGGFTCSAIGTEHPTIAASNIDPSLSVNRYWTITNNATTFTSFNATFNYVAGDIDVLADPSTFEIKRYDLADWFTTTVGAQNPTSTEMTTELAASYPSGSIRHIGIGKVIITTNTYTRVSGSPNWEDASTWIQYRTGTISFDGATTTVTGAGTKFYGNDNALGGTGLNADEVEVGDYIMLQTTPGTVRGRVTAIANNTSLTIDAIVPIISGGWGRQFVPTTYEQIVYIGNQYVAADVNVQLNADATINSLVFYRHAPSVSVSNQLTHVGGSQLTVQVNATVEQPNSDGQTNSWNINDGKATISGNLKIGSNDATVSRIAKIVMTSSPGVLTVNSNLQFNSPAGSAVPAEISISGNALIQLYGSLTLLNGTGTITPGTTSYFNYCSSSLAQTVNFSSAIKYANLNIGNTSSGVTLSANLSTTNVTGDVDVLTNSKLINGGFTITGNAGKTFYIRSGATFELTGNSASSTYPTVFTSNYNAASNVKYSYSSTTPFNISNQPYGNLLIYPSFTATATFPAATVDIAGSLTCGNATNTTTVQGTATTILNVTGNITISANATLNQTNITPITVSGNWINDGTFIAASSKTVVFNSSTALQTIGGNNNTTFGNLTISNTSTGVTLQKPVTVSGTTGTAFTLTSGLLNTDATNLLILLDGVLATSGTSTSYVNGYMKKTGNDNFVFPVGSGGKYARIGIEFSTPGTANATTEYVAKYNLAAAPNGANLGGGVQQVSGVEYWDLARPVGSSTTDNVFVILYWEDGSASGITQTSTLLVTHYNSVTSLWETHGRGLITGDATIGSIKSSTDVSSFSPMAFAEEGGGTNPLPIELLNFEANIVGGKVNLSWSTASELNNDFFTVEKSLDSKNVVEVAKVKGAGNSSVVLNYSAIDENPYPGISYYRLKQTDFDGKFTYSKWITISLQLAKDFTFSVYPNPILNNQPLYIKMSGVENNKEVLVVLRDILGNEMYSKVFIVDESDETVFAIDAQNNLKPGVYLIIGSSNNRIYYKKIVIK